MRGKLSVDRLREGSVTSLPATAELSAPVTVAEIELSDPASVNYLSIADANCDELRQALVLVRLHTRPLATILVEAAGGVVDVESCAAAAWAALPVPLQGVLPAPRLEPQPPLTAASPSISPLVPDDGRQGKTARASEPAITVVVATRERPKSLAACLDSLTRLDYSNYEVVVIDNAPVTDDTAKLLRQRAELTVRYAREDRRGLAAAHNRGLQLAEGGIVAFTDDDVIVDRHWLTEVAKGFDADTNVACVTGLILAAELQTDAQIMLETHGHFAKGFEQRVLDLSTHRPADPLFPFTAGRLGSGANMSFDRDKLRELGGFDPATGTGTIARGGDDLAAFFSVIVSGPRLVYQPSALVWHYHRRDPDSLAGQAYGYGVGLGAYLTSAMANHPAFIGRALLRVPAGLAYAFGANSPRNAHRQGSWPHELTRLELKGLIFGPVAYGLNRWRTRGVRRPRANRVPGR